MDRIGADPSQVLPLRDEGGSLPIQQLLDAIAAPTAILNERGVIHLANRAWRRLALLERGFGAPMQEGADYLQWHRTTREITEDSTAEICAVLDGQRNACIHSLLLATAQGEKRVTARVARLSTSAALRAMAAIEEIPGQNDSLLSESADNRPSDDQGAAVAGSNPEDRVCIPLTSITAELFGSVCLLNTSPELFRQLVGVYAGIMDLALEQAQYAIGNRVSEELRGLAQRLGLLGAGARDVIEIHSEAVNDRKHASNAAKGLAYHQEGRLLLLELMGNLVNHYRRLCQGGAYARQAASPQKDDNG